MREEMDERRPSDKSERWKHRQMKRDGERHLEE
jgi:hypothetical protein